jgi:hypothetical protein
MCQARAPGVDGARQRGAASGASLLALEGRAAGHTAVGGVQSLPPRRRQSRRCHRGLYRGSPTRPRISRGWDSWAGARVDEGVRHLPFRPPENRYPLGYDARQPGSSCPVRRRGRRPRRPRRARRTARGSAHGARRPCRPGPRRAVCSGRRSGRQGRPRCSRAPCAIRSVRQRPRGGAARQGRRRHRCWRGDREGHARAEGVRDLALSGPARRRCPPQTGARRRGDGGPHRGDDGAPPPPREPLQGPAPS